MRQRRCAFHSLRQDCDTVKEYGPPMSTWCRLRAATKQRQYMLDRCKTVIDQGPTMSSWCPLWSAIKQRQVTHTQTHTNTNTHTYTCWIKAEDPLYLYSCLVQFCHARTWKKEANCGNVTAHVTAHNVNAHAPRECVTAHNVTTHNITAHAPGESVTANAPRESVTAHNVTAHTPGERRPTAATSAGQRSRLLGRCLYCVQRRVQPLIGQQQRAYTP